MLTTNESQSFDDNPMQILQKYGLVREDKITFGAYLPFVKDFCLISGIQVGRFKTHTDIIDSSDSVIKIFDDRIEFFNPGSLYDGLTIKQLRNKLIAFMFKECGLIEKYGSGMQRIKKLCDEHRIPEPKFEEIQKGFQVTIYKAKLDDPVNDPVNEIIKLLSTNNFLSYDDIALKLNKGKATIKRKIQKLKSNGILKRVGSDKSGYWETIGDK